MLSRAGDEEDSYINGGKRIATEEVNRKKKAVFDFEGVLFHYTQKVGIKLTSILSRQAHHSNVLDQAGRSGKKLTSYDNVLSHVK